MGTWRLGAVSLLTERSHAHLSCAFLIVCRLVLRSSAGLFLIQREKVGRGQAGLAEGNAVITLVPPEVGERLECDRGCDGGDSGGDGEGDDGGMYDGGDGINDGGDDEGDDGGMMEEMLVEEMVKEMMEEMEE
ncbi:uncharacterized [Tachysurus ichikawai]